MAKLNLKSMKKSTLDHLITFAMVIVAYLIVQILIAAGVLSSLMQGLLVPMCTYSIVAIGLNLCVGYLGELSIGHAGFMCVGAFSSAFATKLLQNVIPNQIILFITVLIIGTAAAAFFGFLIGIPVLRLRGDYLAIVTLAFGEIIKNVINAQADTYKAASAESTPKMQNAKVPVRTKELRTSIRMDSDVSGVTAFSKD